MSAWRIVPSTGGSFWLEREGNGGPGESIYLSGPGDAKAALAALRVHLKAKVEAPPDLASSAPSSSPSPARKPDHG